MLLAGYYAGLPAGVSQLEIGNVPSKAANVRPLRPSVTFRMKIAQSSSASLA